MIVLFMCLVIHGPETVTLVKPSPIPVIRDPIILVPVLIFRVLR